MTDDIKPIFSADVNSPDDMELLKKYFGMSALDEAFESGDGHQTILENAAKARIEQAYLKNAPPHVREYAKRVREENERRAAIRRQTRESEEPEVTGSQLSLF